MKILVADDDQACREYVVTLLEQEGYSCTSVPNALAAADQLKVGDFDLLISDIKMPGNSELELLKSLSSSASEVPIILMTGHPSVETAVPAVALRVAAYLVKPVSSEELLKWVKQTTGQSRAFRTVRDNLQRMEAWNRDLQTVVAGMHSAPADSFNQNVGTFLTLTLRNIIGALSDMRGVIQVVTEREVSSDATRALESSRPFTLLAALQDAVRAIERTRTNFKSKELAELRERLEDLLRDTNPRPPASHQQLPPR